VIFPAIILLIMPKRYPIKIKHKNTKLFPLAVSDFQDFTIETGQEMPKQITISASKISAIDSPSYRATDFVIQTKTRKNIPRV